MLEKEMANMFMNTLPGSYLEHLVGCNASNFADVVSTGGQKRREGDANSISSYQSRGNRRNNFQNYYQQPYVAAVTIPAATPMQQQQPQRQQNQYQQQQGNKPAYQQRQRMMDRSFDTLPLSYAQLLPNLQQLQLMQLRTLAPPVGRLPVGYDANARCNFHSGAPGHTIENCKAFKHVVQDLIDSKAINFAPTSNVVNNPMPQHGGANVNMVEGEVKLVKEVLMLKTPLLEIKEYLLKADVFPDCGNGCLGCVAQSRGCVKLQQGVVEGVVENVDVDPLFPEDAEEFTNGVPVDLVIPGDAINFSDVVADIPNIMVDSDVLVELDSDVLDVCTSINKISEYDYDVATITIFYPTAQINAPVAQPVPLV
ncbi:hypothetical protein KIW84_012912 [Lathyrus oleraceus]|uniref:Gag-pol polyprotein n=1 Tax=Pisum sativum TaxID=3888 RepID=A0A9D5BIY6_PEA|nr:hypothetical protein KIW84_012912 [Pisum sativum]